ncbi:uncharacterized protein LOC128986270 [Macrosteles quadrilineatus]|uniref:uncharacterized protein LOC128986270 n=1 Tax=Macrosteles quadrilineatus TaxID=74068 RepID=UPI0023E2F6BF|nr:uncharacterized protein LOC128986270 [Macrosteles quadrilineatus]
MKEPEETDERRDIKPQDVEEQQTKNRQIADNVFESSTQDDLQDYEEDFEEDVEEGTNVNSTGLEQQSGSEAEKESSESIIEEIVTVEEPIVGETAVTIQKLSSKVSNMIIGGKESLEQPAEVEVDINKDVKLSPNQNILNNQTEAMTEKISIETSPINFNSTSKKTDASVNTSFALIENTKVTVATSPIIQTEKSLPHLKSTTVQTVNLSDSETKSVTSNRINVGETDLTVPSMRLTPKPIENIFNITLGETKENSVALQADQSNQTFKLTVQLHGSDKENKKIVELDSPNESGKILCYPEGRSESDQKSNTNISTNVRNQSSTQRGSKFYDTAEREKIDEQTIKSIIEPTVSEVLKKINTESSHQNERSHPISMADTISSLVKPNIILQTKHGLWQKCNENPFPNIELEQPNPKVDSSNQTEAEKQNVSVQAVDSGTISCEDRPADHCEARPADLTRGYLEMLLPLPPSSLGTVTSCTLSHSSTCGSSSRSSSTSTSSNRKYEILRNSEKLSDGELLPEPCGCKVGEVCPVCVPRLDLSFGEVKTKKRSSRMENDSSSGSNRQTSVPLLNLPLHLEPRPSSVRITRTSELSDVTKSNNLPSDKLANYMTKVRDNLSVAGKVERKNVKHFSEVAQSVLDDLGKELSTLGSVKYTFPKPSPSISVIDPLKNPMDTSSSDSTKSQKGLRSKRNKQKHSLVIKKPVETPRIDVVIEDEELSTSSYQTSVTSVSVDQLPEVSSHSSADASS